MDHLSVSDKNYDKKYNDMQERLDKLYDKFTDLEKKTFLKSFLSDVFIYEEEQKDGRILKGLRFKFPKYMNGRNVLGVDCPSTQAVQSFQLCKEAFQPL